MADGKKEADPGVVFSTIKNKLPVGRLVILLLIIIIAVGASFGYVYSKNNAKKTKAAKEKAAYQAMATKYNQLSFDGQYSQAIDTLQKYLDTKPQNKQYQYQATLWLGTTELNTNHPQEALKYYKQALSETSDPDSNIYYCLGLASEESGDKQAAINYYQQSVQKLDQVKSPSAPLRQDYLLNKISSLKAAP